MAKSFAWRDLLCASLVLCAPATAAERGTVTPACAERDLMALTSIEQQGEAGSTASAVLAEAGLALLQARLSCLEGDEAGALALYDRVLQVKVVSSHPRN
jgi:hypothetical protein